MVHLYIPQFDLLSSGSQIFSLFCIVNLYYFFTVYKILPLCIEVKKFRIKKLKKNNVKLKTLKTFLKSNVNILQNVFKRVLVN
uniref:ATPase subunit 8 n=1 Tax=Coscinodiscus wailesii TaxID=671091 RepID=A0A7T8G4U4_9STRA|nr:ATPase subunit 8 [Coscinodiscus wailesii]QQP21843.1 ATPase subunit 8 [Coscinodiscus wailesii]